MASGPQAPRRNLTLCGTLGAKSLDFLSSTLLSVPGTRDLIGAESGVYSQAGGTARRGPGPRLAGLSSLRDNGPRGSVIKTMRLSCDAS